MRRKCTTNWGRREQEIEIKRCFLVSILGCVIYLKMLTLCPLCFFPLCSLWWKKTPRRTQWEETQGTQLNTNHNRGPLEYHFSILSIENPNPLNLLLQK